MMNKENEEFVVRDAEVGQSIDFREPIKMSEPETLIHIVRDEKQPRTLLRINSSGKFRAVEFKWSACVEEFGLLHVLWGLDIWYGNLPLCKTLLLINILVWLL